MTNQNVYYLGLEDGYADNVCMDVDMTPQAAYAYRKGFREGQKARKDGN